MKTYEEFKELVKEHILAFLPLDEGWYDPNLSEVKKVNCLKDCLTLKNTDKNLAIPVVYLSSFYDKYTAGKSFYGVMTDMAAVIVKNTCRKEEILKETLNLSSVRIIPQVINTAKNRALLNTCPHREVLDLSVVYRMMFDQDEKGVKTALVTNENMTTAGFQSEEELFFHVMNDMKTRNIPVAVNMFAILKNLGMVDPDLEEMMTVDASMSVPQMLVLKRDGIDVNGAAVLLDENFLRDIAKRFKGNYYILPSSIHELIAVPADEKNADEMSIMVSEVNVAQVAPEEVLSDHAYYFNAETGHLETL